MSAFAAALGVLAADPNLGSDAVYRAGGSGPEVVLRVLRSSPDRLGDAFGTSLVQATDVLAVAVTALPAIAPGDTFALGGEVLTVQHAERDAAGVAWRVVCHR
ncbi:head-tail joining protein [Siccirubricoccus phaeus]|uniref:head-tail joining protein n=1 Tax=Siccirubricoccus phaeus TaxID=2595053 RepID=UPI0011F2B710|nr:hypothetical protein [Siccirubricoccus phaeus]